MINEYEKEQMLKEKRILEEELEEHERLSEMLYQDEEYAALQRGRNLSAIENARECFADDNEMLALLVEEIMGNRARITGSGHISAERSS